MPLRPYYPSLKRVCKLASKSRAGDEYLAALFFKIFGVSPFILNFSPLFYLVAALGVWTYILKREFSFLTAAVVLLLSVSSFSMFYQLYERTLPNFAEALLVGGLSFLAFFHLVRHYERHNKLALKSLFGFGLCVGFGFYLFAITGYFFITLGLCSAVILLRPIPDGIYQRFFKDSVFFWRSKKNRADRKTIHKYFKIVATYGYHLLGIAVFLIGFLGLFFFPATFVFNERIIKSNPMALFVGGGLLLLLPGIMRIWRYIASKVEMGYFVVSVLLSGVILGYLPALIHKLFLEGSSKKPMGISGNWDTLVERFGYLIDFHKQLFHLEAGAWSIISALCYLGALVWFFFVALVKAKQYLAGKRENFPKEMLFVVMIIVMVGIFLCARMVVDRFSVRYLIYLSFVYHIVLACFFCMLWKWKPHLRYVWAGILTVPVVMGFLQIQRSLNEPYDPIYKNILAHMEEHGLHYGYSDYWYAYATTFLANEEVILEPIYSNYNPHYGEIVQKENLIAYIEVIDHPKSPLIEDGQFIEIGNKKYKIIKQQMLRSGLRFNVLEAIGVR